MVLGRQTEEQGGLQTGKAKGTAVEEGGKALLLLENQGTQVMPITIPKQLETPG